MERRFVASMWGVLYFFASFAQMLAIVETVSERVEVSTELQFLIAFVVAEIPFLGSVAGIHGAYFNWNLPIVGGIALFIWPIVIILVFLFRFHDRRTSRETVAPTPEPSKDEGTTTISPWMANILKEQVEGSEEESSDGGDDEESRASTSETSRSKKLSSGREPLHGTVQAEDAEIVGGRPSAPPDGDTTERGRQPKRRDSRVGSNSVSSEVDAVPPKDKADQAIDDATTRSQISTDDTDPVGQEVSSEEMPRPARKRSRAKAGKKDQPDDTKDEAGKGSADSNDSRPEPASDTDGADRIASAGSTDDSPAADESEPKGSAAVGRQNADAADSATSRDGSSRPAAVSAGTRRKVYDLVLGQIKSCRETLLAKTNAGEIPSLLRSIDQELPPLFAAVAAFRGPGLTQADLASEVLQRSAGNEEISIQDPKERLAERIDLYQPEITDPHGSTGYLLAQKVGRIGDGVLIRAVNDAVADCTASIAAVV